MCTIRPLVLALALASGSVLAAPQERTMAAPPAGNPTPPATSNKTMAPATDVASAPPTSTTPPARASTLVTRVPRFDELDHNRNGEIERDEFAASMDAASLLQRYDRTGNGKLNRVEYGTYLADRQRYARLKATTPPERR